MILPNATRRAPWSVARSPRARSCSGSSRTARAPQHAGDQQARGPGAPVAHGGVRRVAVSALVVLVLKVIWPTTMGPMDKTKIVPFMVYTAMFAAGLFSNMRRCCSPTSAR